MPPVAGGPAASVWPTPGRPWQSVFQAAPTSTCPQFVLLLVAALANEAATDALAAALWVRPEETDAAPPATEGAPAPAVAASMAGPGESTDRAKPGRAEESRTPLEGRTPIVDLGVYTRNRAMRLYMSRKYGKKASLMPASTNAFEVSGRLAWWRARTVGESRIASSGSGGGGGSSRVALVHADGGPQEVQAGDIAWERSVWDAAFVTPWGTPPESTTAPLASDSAGCGGEGPQLLEVPLSSLLALGLGTESGVFRAQSGKVGSGLHPSPGAGVLAMYNALLREDAPQDGWGRGGDRPAVAVPQTRPAAESPFPPVDAWVLQLAASFGGAPARIRSVAVLTRAVRLVSLDRNAGATSEAAAGEGDRAPRQGESAGAAGAAPTDTAGADRREAALVRRLIYSMADNRFCLRIGRQHRSNNVAFSVDLEAGTANQTCMDPLCRGWRSDAVQVPVEVLPDQVPAGVCVEPVE